MRACDKMNSPFRPSPHGWEWGNIQVNKLMTDIPTDRHTTLIILRNAVRDVKKCVFLSVKYFIILQVR